MNRTAYYQDLKTLARKVRAEHGLSSPRVLRIDMRRIYKAYGVRIDLWPYKLKSLRGAYFNDHLGPTVMIARCLPPDPMIFTLGHELKHHIVDREMELSYCDSSNENEPIEIGAEIFAAEMIFPEEDYLAWMKDKGVQKGQCRAEDIVRMKNDTRTTLSYAGLAKRAEFFEYATTGAFSNVRWKKLEEQIFGEPLYKRLMRIRRTV